MRKQKCLNPECKHTTILARGLCESCYKSAARLVRLKRTTWATLVKKDLAKPATPRGNPGGTMFKAISGKK